MIHIVDVVCIYARHNEHDFLALRVRDNGLKDVKGGLDLLRRSAGASTPLCTQKLNCCRVEKKHILHIKMAVPENHWIFFHLQSLKKFKKFTVNSFNIHQYYYDLLKYSTFDIIKTVESKLLKTISFLNKEWIDI